MCLSWAAILCQNQWWSILPRYSKDKYVIYIFILLDRCIILISVLCFVALCVYVVSTIIKTLMSPVVCSEWYHIYTDHTSILRFYIRHQLGQNLCPLHYTLGLKFPLATRLQSYKTPHMWEYLFSVGDCLVDIRFPGIGCKQGNKTVENISSHLCFYFLHTSEWIR